MIPTFRSILRNFPEWTMGQAKAYKAGCQAAEDERPAQYDDEDDDDMAAFFYRGYADYIGDEAEGEAWFSEIDGWRIEFQWWND